MHWSLLPRLEFLVFDGAVIGFLVWQLISVRRLIRRDREEAAKETSPGGLPPDPTDAAK